MVVGARAPDRRRRSPRALGSFRLGLTGGEPLLRPDVLDVLDLATGAGLHPCLTTNALLITGPSKTADIQQTLAYGAHGPKELVVLLLTGEDAQ